MLQFEEQSHECYLPRAGGDTNRFVDFWSGKSHSGGKILQAAVVLDHIPLFVKAGSIVPLGPHLQVRLLPYREHQPIDAVSNLCFDHDFIVCLLPRIPQYAAEKQQDPTELRVYRGSGDFSFQLYEDDGTTMAHSRKGQWSTIQLTWHEDTSALIIGARNGAFDGQLRCAWCLSVVMLITTRSMITIGCFLWDTVGGLGSFPSMLRSRTFNLVIVGPGHGVGLEPATPNATATYIGSQITLKPAVIAGH
eukprot:SAG31_NODE_1627_length_7705_cov_5.310939_5_plen_249_part_00